MIKRLLLLLVILPVSSLVLEAQMTDQVILKNGSMIMGNVVKIVPDGEVTIEDRAGNIWVFAMAEVKEIVAVEEELGGRGKVPNKGWMNMTSIGFLAGSQSSEHVAPFSMQTSFGYRNSMGIYSGFLAGLEFLDINYIPVMVDFQYSILNTEVVPVVIVRGGYAIPSKTGSSYYGADYSYSGGLTGALGMGLKIGKMENFAWDISILYRYLQINYSESYDWRTDPSSYKEVYNRMEIRLGFSFGI
jgi:hypothetical protein